MAVRAKATTNGSKAEQSLETEAQTEAGTEVGTTETDGSEGEPEAAELEATDSPAVGNDETETTAAEVEPEDTETSTTEATVVAPALTTPTPLSQQEAIAQVSTANHDLVTLLEPLLTSAVTQKRLAELMVRQIGLSNAEGEAWLLHVKRLLETKRKASQSLVRSLIDQA